MILNHMILNHGELLRLYFVVNNLTRWYELLQKYGKFSFPVCSIRKPAKVLLPHGYSRVFTFCNPRLPALDELTNPGFAPHQASLAVFLPAFHALEVVTAAKKDKRTEANSILKLPSFHFNNWIGWRMQVQINKIWCGQNLWFSEERPQNKRVPYGFAWHM